MPALHIHQSGPGGGRQINGDELVSLSCKLLSTVTKPRLFVDFHHVQGSQHKRPSPHAELTTSCYLNYASVAGQYATEPTAHVNHLPRLISTVLDLGSTLSVWKQRMK